VVVVVAECRMRRCGGGDQAGVTFGPGGDRAGGSRRRGRPRRADRCVLRGGGSTRRAPRRGRGRDGPRLRGDRGPRRDRVADRPVRVPGAPRPTDRDHPAGSTRRRPPTPDDVQFATPRGARCVRSPRHGAPLAAPLPLWASGCTGGANVPTESNTRSIVPTSPSGEPDRAVCVSTSSTSATQVARSVRRWCTLAVTAAV
jgi:hypothetical protein